MILVSAQVARKSKAWLVSLPRCRSRIFENQPKHHQRDNRFFVMSAISQDKGHCAENRYADSQHSMCMLFRR